MPGPTFTPIKIPRPRVMKPETLARHTAARAAARAAAATERRRRLRELVRRDGADSIWAELLDIEMEVLIANATDVLAAEVQP
jgi:hypothetical protein